MELIIVNHSGRAVTGDDLSNTPAEQPGKAGDTYYPHRYHDNTDLTWHVQHQLVLTLLAVIVYCTRPHAPTQVTTGKTHNCSYFLDTTFVPACSGFGIKQTKDL